METVQGKKGFHPKRRQIVTLIRYETYLNGESRFFEPIYGGWCTNCADRAELNDVSKTAWRKDEVKVR